MKIITKYTIPN